MGIAAGGENPPRNRATLCENLWMEQNQADSQAVERDLRDFLAANYFLGDDPSQLGASSSLIEAGLIDSTGVLELVGYLEEQFDIRITNEELLPENLDSIQNIVGFVERKRKGTVLLDQEVVIGGRKPNTKRHRFFVAGFANGQ